MTPLAPRPGQQGFSLVGAMSGIAIMMVLMSAAVPSWRYVMQNMREEELIFRGNQIAEAIERYQRKNGGAAPTSIEDLVKGKFLRKAWNDPMSRDGKWKLVKPGEVPFARPGRPGALGGGDRDRPGRPGGRRGMGDERFGRGLGGFVGVATLFEGEAYRVLNGQTRYEEWFFIAGQPRVLGKQQKIVPGVLPGGLPGTGTQPGQPGLPGGGNKQPPPQKPQ